MNAINTNANVNAATSAPSATSNARQPNYDIRLRAYGIPNTKTEAEVKEFLETTLHELTIGTMTAMRIKPYKKNKYTQFHKVDFGVIFNNASARGKSQRNYLSKGKKIVRILDEKHIIIHVYIPKYKPPQADLHTIVPDSDTYDSDLEILYSTKSYFKGLRHDLLSKLQTNSEMARASNPTTEVDPWYAMVESMSKEELIVYMETQRGYSIGPTMRQYISKDQLAVALVSQRSNKQREVKPQATKPPAEDNITEETPEK